MKTMELDDLKNPRKQDFNIRGDSVFFNRAVERMTGYQSSEIMTIDQWFRSLHGANAAFVKRYYEKDRTEDFPTTRTVPITKKK